MATATKTPNLREIATFGGAQVDEEAGIIRGVKILGEISKNGRRYLPEAMRRAIPLYEGQKSYINHPRRTELAEDRDWKGWAGVFQGVHYREGQGLFSDVRLRKKGPHFDEIIEAANDFPNDTGFSHVADGKSTRKGGTEIVESIEAVFSVDLVTDPATTAGMFESVQQEPRTMKVSLSKLIEELPESIGTRKRLVEAVDAKVIDGATEVEFADDADDTAKAAVAMESVFAATLTKLAEAVKEPTPEGDDIKAQLASLKAENARMQAKSMLLESDIEATEVRIKALSTCDESDRKSLLESWPKKEAKPGSGRPASSPPKYESDSSGGGDDGDVNPIEDRLTESLKRARERKAS